MTAWSSPVGMVASSATTSASMPRMENAGRRVQRKDDGEGGSVPLPSKAIGVAVQVSLTEANTL